MNEDERERQESRGGSSNPNVDMDEGDEHLICEDYRSDEERVVYDINNLVMKPGSLYAPMVDFRLAMRQYAINKEFELGIEATNKTRYRGVCKGGDCPWTIYAKLEKKGSPTVKVCNVAI